MKTVSFVEGSIAKAWAEANAEGFAEGQLLAAHATLLQVLQPRFGPDVPAKLQAAVERQTDLATLDRWFKLAVTVASLEKFRTGLRL